MNLTIQGAASNVVSSLATNPQATALAQSASQNAALAASPFANLNLTGQEQTEIQSILQRAQSSSLSFAQVANQIDAVLSPSQQTTFQQDLSTFQAQHKQHHHHHGSGGSSDLFSDLAAEMSVQAQMQASNQSLNV
jgi:hypothetical protein